MRYVLTASTLQLRKFRQRKDERVANIPLRASGRNQAPRTGHTHSSGAESRELSNLAGTCNPQRGSHVPLHSNPGSSPDSGGDSWSPSNLSPYIASQQKEF